MVASAQYTKNIIAALDQAAEANRRTPGRQGSLVTLTPDLADELMVTGDLHGHRRNFNLIKRTADLDAHPRRHLLLQEVCHGGPSYPRNEGCMSHTVLEDVALLKVKYPERVHFILGNHELAEMTDYPIQKNRQMLNLQFRRGLQHMYGPAAEEVREAYIRFLQSCPLAMRLPHGIFISHSLPEGVDVQGFDLDIFARDLELDDCAEGKDVFRLVWGRDYRCENARAFAALVGARVLISGHEPCYEGFLAPSDLHIIIDCCGDNAAYVILPVGQELSHGEIMGRVRKLVLKGSSQSICLECGKVKGVVEDQVACPHHNCFPCSLLETHTERLPSPHESSEKSP